MQAIASTPVMRASAARPAARQGAAAARPALTMRSALNSSPVVIRRSGASSSRAAFAVSAAATTPRPFGANGTAEPYPQTQKPMNVVFISTEVAPWSKTGGLGDVVGSLPIELAKRGHKVISISPRYDQYAGAWDTEVKVKALGKDCRLFHEKKKNVDRIFIDHPDFLAKVWGKTGSKLYGTKSGADFADNHTRFAMFCHAAIESLSALPFGPGEDCVIVCNDWHSALVPVILKTVYKPKGKFVNTKSALCVHNIAFQGRFWPTPMGELGLPDFVKPAFEFTDGNSKVFTEKSPAAEKPEPPTGGKFAKFNWLKAGFLYADKVLTVSPNYASEISSGRDKGVELDDVIRKVGVEGIVNGMDVEEWNPKKDKFLDMPYDKTNVMEGKRTAKAALQAEAGLPLDPKAPLFGYIGRLEEQKGIDILLAAIPKLVAQVPNAQVVILGTGTKKLEQAVEDLGDLSPRVAGVVKFSEPMAHLITAGADFLLVPSRFEPCGLIQLHAMQYGTVPVVATTGGLVDTVKDGVTGFHIGAFNPDRLDPKDVDALVSTVSRASNTYSTPAYATMVRNAISQDLSWKKPAEKWEAVLEQMKFGTAATPESQGKKDAVITPKQKVDSAVKVA